MAGLAGDSVMGIEAVKCSVNIFGNGGLALSGVFGRINDACEVISTGSSRLLWEGRRRH